MFNIDDYISKSINVKTQILNDTNIKNQITEVSQKIVAAFKNGNKILIAGNGGSAADSQHFAAELVSKFFFDRPGLPAIALTTDTSILTAIGNDYGYENSFSRQIQAIGKKGDIFLGISTSGNSKNIVKAVNMANELGIDTVGLVGSQKCVMDDICKTILKVPSNSTPNIQEAQLMIEHMICAIVEDKIFGENKIC